MRLPVVVVISWLGAIAAGCAATDTVALIAQACTGTEECGDGFWCRAGYCEPLWAQDSECSGRLGGSWCSAEMTFPFGLCVCEDLVAGDAITVDAFDSRQVPLLVTPDAGSLAVNGALNGTQSVLIGDTLWVSGASGITLSGGADLTVHGDLHDQGVLMGDVVTIDGDANVGGTISAATLTVAGTLRMPESAVVSATTDNVSARATGEVSVAEQCSCDAATWPDVVAQVHAHRTDNDNAAASLDPFALDGFGEPTTVELPCGRFHVTRIAGSAPLEIVARGAARLFVDGDVALDDAFSVRVEGEGRLDLFVEEGFRVGGLLTVGAPENTADVRVFIAGHSALLLESDAVVSGLVVAPSAELVTQGSLDVDGSLFVRRGAPGGRLSIHQDLALASGLAECASAP